jgi:hypothetical protein
MNPVHPAFGSPMNIVLHANRHTSRLFDSLKTFWIWPRLNDLDPSKRFLTRFLRLVDLGSFIDSRALVDHVARIPVVQRLRPPLFMRWPKSGYVIAELVKFLHGKDNGSIHAGAMFTQYVVAAFFVRFLTSRVILATFSIKEYRLNSPCCAGFWRLSQVHLSWRGLSTGTNPPMG